MQVAVRELAEEGRLTISYTPESDPGHKRKLRELDLHLARRGIRFERVLHGRWQHYTYKGPDVPLILCNRGTCMHRAVVGFKPKGLTAFIPACEAHRAEIKTALASLSTEEISYDLMCAALEHFTDVERKHYNGR